MKVRGSGAIVLQRDLFDPEAGTVAAECRCDRCRWKRALGGGGRYVATIINADGTSTEDDGVAWYYSGPVEDVMAGAAEDFQEFLEGDDPDDLVGLALRPWDPETDEEVVWGQ